MKLPRILLVCCAALPALSALPADAQYITPLPFDRRILSDVNLGNVAGAKRLGRQLRRATKPSICRGLSA